MTDTITNTNRDLVIEEGLDGATWVIVARTQGTGGQHIRSAVCEDHYAYRHRWFVGEEWDMSCRGKALSPVEMIRTMADDIIQSPVWKGDYTRKCPPREEIIRRLCRLFPISSRQSEDFLAKSLA